MSQVYNHTGGKQCHGGPKSKRKLGYKTHLRQSAMGLPYRIPRSTMERQKAKQNSVNTSADNRNRGIKYI